MAIIMARQRRRLTAESRRELYNNTGVSENTIRYTDRRGYNSFDSAIQRRAEDLQRRYGVNNNRNTERIRNAANRLTSRVNDNARRYRDAGRWAEHTFKRDGNRLSAGSSSAGGGIYVDVMRLRGRRNSGRGGMGLISG